MSNAITVDVLAEHPLLHTSDEQELSLVLKIQTPASAHQRPPLHVSVVMDRSGSMHGDKLKHAKRAVRKLIKHLNVNDTLHFVCYDSDVATVFSNGDLSPEGKADLENRVREITANSATNLCGGLERGVQLLRSAPTGETKRVFLFSDGLVNAGVQDASSILQRIDRFHNEDGVTFSAFGIGRDFDESLMTQIARRGNGSFEFLDKPNDIPSQVSKSVHGLLALSGFDATLQLHPSAGCTVTNIACVDAEEEDAQEVSLIELGDLHSNNTRQVLMRVAVSTKLSSTEEQQVLEYELQYCSVDSTDGGREALRGRAMVACTDRPEEAAQQNPEVLTAIAIQAAVRHDFEAATALEDGEIDIALSAKRASIAVLELALQKLNGQAALVQRLEKLIERGQETLQKMESDSDMRSLRLEVENEGRRARRMSDCDMMMSRCDSDDGNWTASEDEEEPRRARRLRHSDSESENSGDDGPNNSPRFFYQGRSSTPPPHRVRSRSISPPMTLQPPLKSSVRDCQVCQAAFGMFRWRHSCEQCNMIVCDGCSQKNSAKKMRMCYLCKPDDNTTGTSAVPSSICPITHNVMTDPVIASDGHSYEREAILQWLQTSSKSPLTGQELLTHTLITNHALRNLIEEQSK